MSYCLEPHSACDYIVHSVVSCLGPYPPQNATIDVPSVYLAQAIIYSLEFTVSVVGTIMSLIFTCRRKTNFLMRVLIYSSVITTLILGISWVYSVPAFAPGISMVAFCNSFYYGIFYTYGTLTLLLTASLLSCSFSLIFVQKFCSITGTCNNCCQCCQRNRLLPRSAGVCLEVLFIAVIIMVAIPSAYTLLILRGRTMTYYFELLFVLVYLLTFGLSHLSDILLVILLCIRRDYIARRRVMLKEIGIFFVHVLESILVGLVYILFCIGSFNRYMYVISGQAAAIGLSILLTPLSLFPLCVFVYMRYILRIPPREDRREGNNRYDIQTAGGGLQTVPPSTRVSLPSDTAAHAPNFLSPSTAEPTDVTPLLN